LSTGILVAVFGIFYNMAAAKLKGPLLGILLVFVFIAGSFFFSKLWKPEDTKAPTAAKPAVAKAQEALSHEYATKDWKKIPIKMGLWGVFLVGSYVAVRRGKYNARNRKWFYLGAVALFGVALGSDPSPMGTVKDAIVLLAKSGAVFPPRLIALTLFLLTVVLANKAICAWGCQLGTLQDLLFRLNRNKADTRGLLPQFKIPFAVSNSIRIGVFAVFAGVAFFAAYDIIGAADPFKTFDPAKLGLAGAVLVGILVSASFFVYRPWCYLACPFGLTGWLFERFSRVKIRVNESTCTKCLSCAKACPSDAMQAIVLQKRALPDCFSCGTCIDVCPSKSIAFSTKKEHEASERASQITKQTAGFQGTS